MGRRFGLISAFCLALAGAGTAQDRAETLADIRQELSVLYVDIQRLNRELSTTGAPSSGSGSGALLDRVNTLESALTRLTAKTEELEFRINRVVADGNLKIGDLEFRICELEEGCDIGALPETRLGGGEGKLAGPTPVTPASTTGAELATNEQTDFERASEALAQGDFRSAAEQFEAFNATYPGGPLAIAADLRRGEALEGMADTRAAARAYLTAFQLEPAGPLAAEALFLLGRSLGRLGQSAEACVTLGEVAIRFPDSEAVVRAAQEISALGCA